MSHHLLLSLGLLGVILTPFKKRISFARISPPVSFQDSNPSSDCKRKKPSKTCSEVSSAPACPTTLQRKRARRMRSGWTTSVYICGQKKFVIVGYLLCTNSRT